MTYTEQSTEKGMGIHPSIGRFSEKDQANPLHSKKPNVGATASKTYDGQSLATQSNHGTHQQESASSDVGGIVNLRSPSSTEGKVRNLHNRKSLFNQSVLLSTLIQLNCQLYIVKLSHALDRPLGGCEPSPPIGHYLIRKEKRLCALFRTVVDNTYVEPHNISEGGGMMIFECVVHHKKPWMEHVISIGKQEIMNLMNNFLYTIWWTI